MHRMEQQLLIEIKDIYAIAVHCSRCGSETVVNLLNEESGVPEKCSCCREDFGSLTVQQPAREYVKAYRALVKVQHRITLRVKPQAWKPEVRP